jgi:hypothetical protein
MIEEHRLSVFENRMLGKVSEPKRDEETRDSTKLSREFHNLFL